MILIEKKIEKILEENIKKLFPDFSDWGKLYIQKSSNEKFGDFQTNFAMVNAKYFKTNPRNVAQKIVKQIENEDFFSKVETAGPGFINFYIADEHLEKFIKAIGQEEFDFSFLDREGDVIIDYSSPNIAKRMHIGHLRSTVIGDSIKRIFAYLGYNILADNHLGDWGTQFGKLIVGYKKWLDKENYKKNPIEELERIYVKFSQESIENEDLKIQARQELVKLHEGEEEVKKLWKEFVDISLEEYKKLYKRMNIDFDLYLGESFYHDMMPEIVQILKEKNIAVKDEGAWVIFFDEEKNLHPCIVQKQDGAFNYATSDLAALKYKKDNYEINQLIYVTDSRQEIHFKQVFEIAEELKWDFKKVHVPFGLMKFKDGIFSSRKGNVIRLETLMDKAVERIKSIIEDKNPDLPEAEKSEIAEKVGIGAVKYADLSQNRTSDVVFNWEKMLSFEGNTGPYLQYTYARIQSIIRKADEKNQELNKKAKLLLDKPEEKSLASFLTQFPDAVLLAAKSYEPNKITEYLYNLCKRFNSFYNALPILKEEENILQSRLLLAERVSKVLEIGLDLCGIEVMNRM